MLPLLQSTWAWIIGLGLAAFLALFWVLRGAPIGQSVTQETDQDAPRGGYRDRVIAAMCLGLLLIVLGGYLAVTQGVPWSLPAFALGFATVIALLAINQRYRHGSPTMRRTVELSTTLLNAALFGGILIVVNVIAYRYGGKAIDMTHEGAYTLESLTVTQLKSLKTPVTFTTFFGRSAVASQEFDRVQQLLELYKTANPDRVRLEHINPFQDLGRYEALVKKVPEIEIAQGGGVIVEYGDGEAAERIVVRNADLFERPRAARFDPSAERFETVFKGEDALTSALIRLREGKKPRIVFLTGHGEGPLDDLSNSPGLGIWKARLIGTGFEVLSLNLLTQDIPEDAALVVVVGPKTPYKPDEITRLKAYSDQKSPLLMLLGDTEETGLETYLKDFGVDLGKGIVLEPLQNYRNPQVVVVPITGQSHELLESLNNQVVLMARPAPLTLAGTGRDSKEQTIAATSVVTTALLKTTAQAWSEPDLSVKRPQRDPKSPTGPFTVGVVANDRPAKGESAPGKPRLVLFSSRYMGDNGMVQVPTANLDLLMNSVNWLRGRPDLKGIAPRTHQALALTADPAMRARLIMVPTVMAVLLIVTLGLSTYFLRRA